MARIEKTVFISYRRTDVYTALAVYENLKNQGYDVFFDYRSISSGDFEQIITANIRARAHFLIILTPTALDRLNEPGDWLRREIEIAIDQKRNIIPLFFKGFRFGTVSVSEKLTGKLKTLSRYNGLNVHEDYFEEAMHRLRTQFLNKPLDTVLHPVSTEVQKVVRAEQIAADRALEQIEDVKELAKQSEEKPSQPQPAPALDPKEAELERLESMAIQHELRGKFWDALQFYYQIRKLDPLFPRVDVKIRELEKETQPKPVPAMASQAPVIKPTRNAPVSFRLVAIGIAALLVIILCIWGGINIWNNLSTPTPDPIQTLQPANTDISSLTKTPTPLTSTLGIGSTMTGKDGMILLYVPAGEFTMGSEDGSDDEKPIHTVNVDAFWIDQFEVTNAMFAKFVGATAYITDAEKRGKSWLYQESEMTQIDGADWSHPSGPTSGISDIMNHPVVHVSWNDALAYCLWTDRRLPTEAEWEKAASWDEENQLKKVYPWGNDFNGNILNFCDKNCPFSWADKDSDDGYIYTAPTGMYPSGASLYGVLDMAGNVEEWVADYYSDTYFASSPISNPSGPDSGTYRVVRDGSWSIYASSLRSTDRDASSPLGTSNGLGFRCAVSQIMHTDLTSSTLTPVVTNFPTFTPWPTNTP